MWKLLPCANWLRYNQKVTNSMLMTEILKEISSNWVWRIYYVDVRWLTKCADDSETANYISAHTKVWSGNYFSLHNLNRRTARSVTFALRRMGDVTTCRWVVDNFVNLPHYFKPPPITFKLFAVLQLQARFLLDVPWGLEESWERVLRVL